MVGEFKKRIKDRIYYGFDRIQIKDENKYKWYIWDGEILEMINEAKKEFPMIGDTDKTSYAHEYEAVEEWIGKVEKWRKKWFGNGKEQV